MEPLDDVIATLRRDASCNVEMCGSKVTCDPPPEGTDTDYRVEVPDNDKTVNLVVNLLHTAGFEWESNEHYQLAARDGFMSWRRDDVNFIVIANPELNRRHRLATELCRKLNLMKKADRIMVFQAILYDNVDYSIVEVDLPNVADPVDL